MKRSSRVEYLALAWFGIVGLGGISGRLAASEAPAGKTSVAGESITAASTSAVSNSDINVDRTRELASQQHDSAEVYDRDDLAYPEPYATPSSHYSCGHDEWGFWAVSNEE